MLAAWTVAGMATWVIATFIPFGYVALALGVLAMAWWRGGREEVSREIRKLQQKFRMFYDKIMGWVTPWWRRQEPE